MKTTALLYRPLLILAATLLLSACASTRYEQDYHPDTNFQNYQTYVWRSGEAQIPGVDMARLQRIAQEALEEQGLIMDPEAPDLLLSLHAFTRRTTGGSRGVGLSIGVPIGRSGTLGVGSSRALSPTERQEGVMVLDVTETRSNELIWRGTASAIPLEHFKLAQEERLKRTLDRLTQQFPPE
ncbi:DUF4136 domain-containing protein [Marinimicrobium sp. ABcell2]|uniref:DUF4136 domain-containing protein n=1 Tax=Marinimicrobium sp. ABcell2 TaxID=3069751 RepID=UPI0027B0CC8A|nr:DUF4136 domain-containing protein [Marinimicrobium sp. ABcell2]MDQ2076525.1 DUF4136 domain-containing protein [Marinimicrobium sp. ABcell2]